MFYGVSLAVLQPQFISIIRLNIFNQFIETGNR